MSGVQQVAQVQVHKDLRQGGGGGGGSRLSFLETCGGGLAQEDVGEQQVAQVQVHKDLRRKRENEEQTNSAGAGGRLGAG